jgi:hypothetical protein
MIEPKVMEFSEGEYVLHSDYARLKAEVENSKRINTELLVLSNRQASDIRRLTKAGDAMASGLQGMAGERPKALADEWNDAKKGGRP